MIHKYATGSLHCACLRICAKPRALALKFVHDLVQAVRLDQNHEHTQIISIQGILSWPAGPA